MKVKLIRQFSCAPEGHTVVRFDAGSILEGNLAILAMDEDVAIEVAEMPPLETKIDTPKKKARKG